MIVAYNFRGDFQLNCKILSAVLIITIFLKVDELQLKLKINFNSIYWYYVKSVNIGTKTK